MKKMIFVALCLTMVTSLLLSVGCDEENDIILPETDDNGSAPARLVVEPDTLTIDDDNQPGILYLATYPPGDVTWRLASTSSWVTVDPDSGHAGTQISQIAVTCDDDGLQPGVHRARLEIISTGGSADIDVFFNVKVHPLLTVSDTLIAFVPGSDAQTLVLQNVGTGSVDWTLDESADWLITSRTYGSIWPGGHSQIGLSINRTGLAPGSYETVMTLSSNAEGGDIDIRVTLEVAAQAILTLGTTSLDLGFFTDAGTVKVTNTGNVALDWSVETDQAFIAVDPAAGTVAVGDTTTVSVTVDRTGLATGTHPAILTFHGPDQQEATVAVQIEHFENELVALDYRIVDAEYDRNHDVIVAVSTSPNRLVIRDPETGDETAVTLSLTPSCVSIQPGGDLAAVGHDGNFSLVDLTSGTVTRTYAVTTNAVDIVLATNGYCYVFPRTDQWEGIRCIQLATGVETTSGGYSIYAGTLGKLHPSGEYMYGANNGLSPSDFEKYDIRPGTATVMYDSPYHGDYAFSGDIWIADDGLRLFARSGNVFRSSTVRAEDMTYAGSLAGATYLEWVEHSSAANLVLAIPAASYYSPAASEIRVYSNDFLALQGVRALPQFLVPDGQGGGDLYNAIGQFVFIDQAGDRFHALVKAEGGAGLLKDWAQYSGNVADLAP
jgi:hypothetical protein